MIGQDKARHDITDKTDQNKIKETGQNRAEQDRRSFLFIFCAGEITSRLSRDTNLMGRTVCLNVNVLLRTFIMTLGMLSLMMNLSWKLTFLVLMETPITGLIQNIYDTHYQVKSRLIRNVELTLRSTESSSISITKKLILGILTDHCWARLLCL